MAEKTENLSHSEYSEIQPPSEAEFQVLSAIWQHKEAVGLSEICETVRHRLSLIGMPPPATTTISTYVRRLIDKGLVRPRRTGSGLTLRVGLLSPRSKPSAAVYEPTCEPSVLMLATFETLVNAYPSDERRMRPLHDLIQVMKLPKEKTAALACVVDHEGDTESLLLKLVEQLPLDKEKRRTLRAALAEAQAKGPSTSDRSGRK